MRVAVAMSGGADSTAAALLLKREGYEVLGLHMILRDEPGPNWESARRAAEEIGVPILPVDLVRQFDDLVVKPFVDEYALGRTPSPCPLCNRRIKMTLLREFALSKGCSKIATGHYARVVLSSDGPALLRGTDTKKDQSYFLSMLTLDMLENALFPLGGVEKTQVRDLLKSEGISVWQREESQELCFVPEADYREFLARKGVAFMPGPIVDMDGKTLGTHRGIIGFTVGQRRGLGICGKEPLYVVGIDASTNTVIVGNRDQTYVSLTELRDVNLLAPSLISEGSRLQVMVRSTSRPVDCTVARLSGDSMKIRYDEPRSGVAPGQAAVLYSNERVVAAGWIERSSRG